MSFLYKNAQHLATGPAWIGVEGEVPFGGNASCGAIRSYRRCAEEIRSRGLKVGVVVQTLGGATAQIKSIDFMGRVQLKGHKVHYNYIGLTVVKPEE
jgi:hypothetical protein